MRSLRRRPDAESISSGGEPRHGHRARLLRAAAWAGAALIVMAVIPVAVLRWVDPPTSAFMVERRMTGILMPSRRVDIHYRWTDWDAIAPEMKLAVVASEDQRFPEHRGFDFASMRDAVAEQERRGRLRGASTISQQVAKNLFLWPGRSYLRKALEAGFTVVIESLWPKRRILEIYLNVAEFGDGIYGVGAASSEFFRERPSDLSVYESALLATVLPNPRRLHADRPSAYVLRRTQWVEAQMARMGPGYLRGL